MKKLLIGTAAISLGVFGIAGHAKAEGLKLNLAGHFKGYVDYLSQDDDVDTDASTDNDFEKARRVDILRETEIHFTGETTLDNGLTVGFHEEVDVDGTDSDDGDDGLTSEESYLYMSGAWGRVNFGKEDGAAYLLQVAAPSADSNYDGLRQYVSPFDFGLAGDDLTTGAAGDLTTIVGFTGRFDYDNALSGNNNKITYLSPVFSGFQAGISYTPEVSGGVSFDNGNAFDDVANDYGSAWDAGVRWEGQWDEVGIALGAGYSHVDLEDEDTLATTGGDLDDRTAWDLGVDLNWGPFGIGAAYLRDDHGIESIDGGAAGTDLDGLDADAKTWTVGADYTTGPFKIGASYYRQTQELAGLDANGVTAGSTLGTGGVEDVTGSLRTTRWTGGVVYTYGPGMTFRGSVSHINADLPASADGDDFSGTTVLLGTQVDF